MIFKKIRRVWHEEEGYFFVAEVYDKIVLLKLQEEEGKLREELGGVFWYEMQFA